VLSAGFTQAIDPPWTTMDPVLAGEVPRRLGTPIIYVTVEADGEPLLRIDVHEREPSHHAFQDAIAWADFVVVGFGNHVHLVAPTARTCASFRLAGYFGHLYPEADRLLVADAERLWCFDGSGSLQWRSPELGLDGVVVDRVADGVVEGKGEWDPPGGWRTFRVYLASGEIVSAAR
jgi:hypothetical protein